MLGMPTTCDTTLVYCPRMTATFTSELAERLADDLLERFLRYVRDRHPVRARPHAVARARPGQLELGRLLVDELLERSGSPTPQLDDNGYVIATLPATGRRRRRSG